MTAVDPRVRVSLIESFGVEVDGCHLPLPRNAERLLAYLALRGGVHQRSHVSATLWLDSPEERAAANLRTVLWKLADSKDRLVALTRNAADAEAFRRQCSHCRRGNSKRHHPKKLNMNILHWHC